MSTEPRSITVSGIRVQLVRKPIKHLHVGVYPPGGRVRVAAPPHVSNEAVRLALIRRLAWIRRQQARFQAQPRQTAREVVSGESHYFQGRRYRLRIIESTGPTGTELQPNRRLVVRVRPGADAADRERVLHRWYRRHLRAVIPLLLAKWEAALGVHVAAWGIRRMKTKWGACNPATRRVWFNLELAKKSPGCLEYIIVHELVHLLERHHNERFVALMERHLPTWRARRAELSAAPLAHEHWAAAAGRR